MALGKQLQYLVKTNKQKQVPVRKDVIVLVVQSRFQGSLLKGPAGERPANKVIACKARLCSKKNVCEIPGARI